MMMDARAAKLALARQKLKDHQVKKSTGNQLDEHSKQALYVDNTEDKQVEEEYVAITTESMEPIAKLTLVQPPQKLPANLTTNNHEKIMQKKLEAEISDLLLKISQLDYDKNVAINDLNVEQNHTLKLQLELNKCNTKLSLAQQDQQFKNNLIQELQEIKASLSNDNSNLKEQLEFTKTLLASKQSENDTLITQFNELQNKFEMSEVQLQQLAHGAQTNVIETNENVQIEHLQHRITNLELEIAKLQKERDHISAHYEHYVAELNQNMNSILQKNEDLNKEVERLSIRESSLIEQISDMEIRVQNYKIRNDEQYNNISSVKSCCGDIHENYAKAQAELQQLNTQCHELEMQYLASEAKIKQLSHSQESRISNSVNDVNISLSKLNADMTSNKIAAQRATEQNKKLKVDIEELEKAFVKMSQDKLELTEKLTAEKYLNRELTIKLSEVESKFKENHLKLLAKDEEMMRLQANFKNIEARYRDISNKLTQNNTVDFNSKELTDQEDKEQIHNSCQHHESNKASNIPTEDAMIKLQNRFLKIMEDVADLSDEKHRLEHIILQLQNETETICEYVALYQQQRSLLKKRDEERSAQMKIFQNECDRLKSQLEELTGIIKRLAGDKELAEYFKMGSRENDITKVMNLLTDLKQNSLVDPQKNDLDFRNFYPCSCCSGKLIEV